MPETENATFRSAVMTIFNIGQFDELPEKLQYFAYGKEVCPTTGREHLQAYGYASKPMRLTQWKKVFPGAHIEPMRGTFAENERYCSKQGQLVEFGEKPLANGRKRTLAFYTDAIIANPDVPVAKHVKDEHSLAPTFVQYKNGLNSLRHYFLKEKMYDEGFVRKSIYVFIGPSQFHKSRSVRNESVNRCYSMPDNKLQWAGSYDGESDVVFDDVASGDIMPLSIFLKITDGYPYEVPVKGGYVPWVPKRIFFTSNHPIEEWWPWHWDAQKEAVLRRVTEVRVYKGPGEYDVVHSNAETSTRWEAQDGSEMEQEASQD